MTDRPCATCNQPHPQRRGRDGLPTFAAEDGHPFRVVGSEGVAERDVVVGDAVVIRSGFREGLSIYPPHACDVCHCLVANDGLAAHRGRCS